MHLSVFKFNNIYLLIIPVALLLVSCGGPVLTKENVTTNLTDYLHEKVDSAAIVEADIMVSVKGERHSAEFLASIKNKNSSNYKIYSPLFGDFVNLKSEKDSLFLFYDNVELKVSKADGLQKLPFFSNYPFNFNQFSRILTGTLPFSNKIIVDKGKFREVEDGGVIKLESDGLYLKLSILGHGGKKTTAKISDMSGSNWKLSYSKFSKQRFKKVTFSDDEGNGFILDFKN